VLVALKLLQFSQSKRPGSRQFSGMKTNVDSGTSAAPAAGWSPRIHRASSAGQAKKPRKVLLVDDNALILKTTSGKLKEAGYEVLTAEDGGSAIRQARQLKPHLIILDLNFPPDVGHGGGIPWDGFLILNWLRRTDGMEKVPVIVITGGDLEKHKDKWVEAGVRDIFLKPIDHEALLAAMRWALDQEVAEQEPAPTETSAEPAAELPSVLGNGGLSMLDEKSPGKGKTKVTEPAVRPKILFIDDTNDWRYLGASCLEERYDVVTAEDPISAMLAVSRAKPNLVVLDLNLGGQSAVTLLKLLSERFPELPVLIYTGMELNTVEISELLKQGAWNLLRKGSLEELVAAVEKTISGPKAPVAQILARLADKETAKAPIPAAAKSGSQAPTEKTVEGAESTSALPSLNDLRTGTTEELLSAVGKARKAVLEQPPVVPVPVVALPEPIVAVPDPVVIVPEEAIEPAAESALIVEDDAAFTETLRSFLESQSFHVSAATTGAEAVSLIASTNVSLILFDLTLPGFRVKEFYEAVRAAKPHLCSRIVFMTSDESHPSDDGFVRKLKGISLWKPFPMDWLLEAVNTFRAATQQSNLAAK